MLTAASENSSWHSHRTKATFGDQVSPGFYTGREKESQYLKSGFSEGSFILSAKRNVSREAESWQDGVKGMPMALWYCSLALLSTRYPGKYKLHLFLLVLVQSSRVLELSSILLLTMFCRNLLQYSADCSNFVSSYKAPQLVQRLLLTQIH